jgi:hypothetical protein
MTFLFFVIGPLCCQAAAAQTAPPESREDQAAENVFKNIQAFKECGQAIYKERCLLSPVR